MTLAIAIEKRLKTEIARALEIMERVRDRPEGLNEADTKGASVDPGPLGWELRDPVTSHPEPISNGWRNWDDAHQSGSCADAEKPGIRVEGI